ANDENYGQEFALAA
ncbi:proteolysis tag peptide encoded by tmRNA, partial [Pseudomonas synxantha]